MADVTISHLSKRFGKVDALKDVSLTIRDGAFVALMGPSGCGKTTLLRLLSGLEMADAGTITIGSRDVSATPPEKRDIGLMFQSYALFPHMTVAENLSFPMRMRRDYDAAERERRIRRALDLVRLPDIRDRTPRQLSGGQQQRVAFARALIDEPSVLLLDEPLSNLDARLRDEMQMELIEIRRQAPITTILVTHDQTEGLTLADEIVVMRAGRVEQAGLPRAVYSEPATVFVADFLGGANLVRVDAAPRRRQLARDGAEWRNDSGAVTSRWQAGACDADDTPGTCARAGAGPDRRRHRSRRDRHRRLSRPVGPGRGRGTRPAPAAWRQATGPGEGRRRRARGLGDVRVAPDPLRRRALRFLVPERCFIRPTASCPPRCGFSSTF